MGVTAAVAAVVGTGYSVYSGEKQKKQQKKSLAMQTQKQRTRLQKQQILLIRI